MMMWDLILVLVTLIWITHSQYIPEFNVIVAQDGTGNFTKISDAILSAPSNCSERYYIKVKKGNYAETVIVGKKKTNIVLVGDGMDNTIISGSKSTELGISTLHTATVGMVSI